MKIDLVTPRFHPSVGGIEESVTQLARGLQARGHEVLVHTARLGDAPTSDQWRGIPVRRYNLVLDRGFYVSRFEPLLSGDVLHLHAYAHQTNDWVIEKHGGDRPILFSTHHGIRFPKKRFIAKLYHARYNRRRGVPNLRRVDRVLVPTAVDRDEFISRGVEPEKIVILPSGVDDEAFKAHAPWTPKGVKGEFLLFLGRIHEEKGIVDLVRAYQFRFPGLPLVIAGKDEGGLRKAGPLPDGIHVVTDLDSKKKWGLLAACRALVLPSHYEGQGIVVGEAWALRKPVVATRAGGLAGVVTDGVDGLLVDVGDRRGLAHAMERICANGKLASRLAAKGHAEVQRSYRWPALVDKVEALYRAAAKARR